MGTRLRNGPAGLHRAYIRMFMGGHAMSRHAPADQVVRISLGRLHEGQVRAYAALRESRFKALRCGRRFGKSELAKSWIMQGLVQGEACAWIAPQHMTSAEVFHDLRDRLGPLLQAHSRADSVMRLATCERLDLWSLENPIAGSGRGYARVVIDEAAYTKRGDSHSIGSMQSLWETAIKSTLYDQGGQALVRSNAADKDPGNFFYAICTDPRHGFQEFHATTKDNPCLPKREPGKTKEAWHQRRQADLQALKDDNDPLVHAQEYLAEFVDWSGQAFFSCDKLLEDGQPIPVPAPCDTVFAVIDTASTTGTDNDATAVTFFSINRLSPTRPLCILDWDIVQIEGALLEAWLLRVFTRLDELARQCRARYGSIGACIEDKNSGAILLQQALRRRLPARKIESRLTALGKDERALSVSGYIHQGLVKYTEPAFNKIADYKRTSRNHLLDHVERFRIGDKRSHREDDLLDTFCNGIAMALGNSEGF